MRATLSVIGLAAAVGAAWFLLRPEAGDTRSTATSPAEAMVPEGGPVDSPSRPDAISSMAYAPAAMGAPSDPADSPGTSEGYAAIGIDVDAAVPARRFVVLVRRGPAPETKGRVLLAVAESDDVPGERGWIHGSRVLSRNLDADGLVAFDKLPEGRYLAGVEIDGTLVRECVFRNSMASRSSRILLELGNARVQGRVVDADGRGRPGVPVTLVLRARAGLVRQVVRTASGEDGEYEVARLPAGSVTLEAGGPMIAVELAEGEVKVQDLSMPGRR